MPFPILPVIAAGTQILGDVLSNASTNRQNKLARQFSLDMYNRQRSDALADWNMQNEYNSPAAQMQRLKAAGLNPFLVYGNGADAQMGGPVRSANVQPWSPRPLQFHTSEAFGAGLGAYYDMQIKEAQVNNLKAQTDVSTMDTIMRAAQIINTRVSTGKTRVDTETAQFNLDMQKQLKNVTIEAAQAALDRTKAETFVSLSANERAIASNAVGLQKAAEEILSIRAQRANTEAERREINQRIQNMQKDGELKQLDIQLKRLGIQPGDNMFMRMLGRVISGGTFSKDVEGIKSLQMEHEKKYWFNPDDPNSYKNLRR